MRLTRCTTRRGGITACAPTALPRFTSCRPVAGAATGGYSPTPAWTRPFTPPADWTGLCPSQNCAGRRTSPTLRTVLPRRGSATTFAANSKGADMNDDILPLLKVHEYFRGLPDEALREVVQHGQITHHPAGSTVHEANVLLTTVGFVLRGRLKAVRVNANGAESFFRMIERGEQFGMMI